VHSSLRTATLQKGERLLFSLKQARRWLWQALAAIGSTIWQSYVRFAQRHHLLYAAAISYYGLLSLVPLLALALSLFGRLLRSEEASQALGEVLGGLFPVPAKAFVSAARAISATSPWADLVYLFGLIWAGAYLFESIERVVNAVCGGATDRAYHMRKLIGMAAVVAAGFLLLISVALWTSWTALGQLVQLPGSEWVRIGILIKRTGILLPLFTSTLVFTLVYKLLPKRRIPWRAALAGGVFAGLFWEISKLGFGLFVVFSGREYGTLYGSLANVVIIMLWFHLSAIILILGAHIGCIVQERLESAAQGFAGSAPTPEAHGC